MPQLGGKSFTDRSTGGTPILQRSDTGSVNWVSGWYNSFDGTAVANGATFVLTHNLNSTDIITNAFVNNSATDTNAQTLGYYEVGTYNLGYAITNITPNTVTIQIGDDGYGDVTSTGGVTYTNISGKYLKFIISAGAGAGGGGYIDSYFYGWNGSNPPNHQFPGYSTSQKVVVTGISVGDGQWAQGGSGDCEIPPGGSKTFTHSNGTITASLTTSGVLSLSHTAPAETAIHILRFS